MRHPFTHIFYLVHITLICDQMEKSSFKMTDDWRSLVLCSVFFSPHSIYREHIQYIPPPFSSHHTEMTRNSDLHHNHRLEALCEHCQYLRFKPTSWYVSIAGRLPFGVPRITTCSMPQGVSMSCSYKRERVHLLSLEMQCKNPPSASTTSSTRLQTLHPELPHSMPRASTINLERAFTPSSQSFHTHDMTQHRKNLTYENWNTEQVNLIQYNWAQKTSNVQKPTYYRTTGHKKG